MIRNRTSLILFMAAVMGVLIVPSMVQARSRTGSDLGTRVAAIEVQQATNTANIAANAAAIAALDVRVTASEAAIAANAAAIAAHVADTGNAHGHDSRYVRSFPENLRVLRGWVSSGGFIIAGSGFSISKTGTGVYVITYATAFGSTPMVNVNTGRHVNVFPLNSTSATITILDGVFPGGSPIDGAFFVTVIGPQ